jgi:uncharacterized membrane protein
MPRAAALVALTVIALAAGSASAAVAPPSGAAAHAVLAGHGALARGAFVARRGGLGRPGYRSPARRTPRGYPYRTRRNTGFLRGVLQGLGIAWLVHALFGWGGGGGSPFGLLLIVAVIAWLVTRRRRQRLSYRA